MAQDGASILKGQPQKQDDQYTRRSGRDVVTLPKPGEKGAGGSFGSLEEKVARGKVPGAVLTEKGVAVVGIGKEKFAIENPDVVFGGQPTPDIRQQEQAKSQAARPQPIQQKTEAGFFDPFTREPLSPFSPQRYAATQRALAEAFYGQKKDIKQALVFRDIEKEGFELVDTKISPETLKPTEFVFRKIVEGPTVSIRGVFEPTTRTIFVEKGKGAGVKEIQLDYEGKTLTVPVVESARTVQGLPLTGELKQKQQIEQTVEIPKVVSTAEQFKQQLKEGTLTPRQKAQVFFTFQKPEFLFKSENRTPDKVAYSIAESQIRGTEAAEKGLVSQFVFGVKETLTTTPGKFEAIYGVSAAGGVVFGGATASLEGLAAKSALAGKPVATAAAKGTLNILRAGGIALLGTGAVETIKETVEEKTPESVILFTGATLGGVEGFKTSYGKFKTFIDTKFGTPAPKVQQTTIPEYVPYRGRVKISAIEETTVKVPKTAQELNEFLARAEKSPGSAGKIELKAGDLASAEFPVYQPKLTFAEAQKAVTSGEELLPVKVEGKTKNVNALVRGLSTQTQTTGQLILEPTARSPIQLQTAETTLGIAKGNLVLSYRTVLESPAFSSARYEQFTGKAVLGRDYIKQFSRPFVETSTGRIVAISKKDPAVRLILEPVGKGDKTVRLPKEFTAKGLGVSEAIAVPETQVNVGGTVGTLKSFALLRTFKSLKPDIQPRTTSRVKLFRPEGQKGTPLLQYLQETYLGKQRPKAEELLEQPKDIVTDAGKVSQRFVGTSQESKSLSIEYEFTPSLGERLGTVQQRLGTFFRVSSAPIQRAKPLLPLPTRETPKIEYSGPRNIQDTVRRNVERLRAIQIKTQTQQLTAQFPQESLRFSEAQATGELQTSGSAIAQLTGQGTAQTQIQTPRLDTPFPTPRARVDVGGFLPRFPRGSGGGPSTGRGRRSAKKAIRTPKLKVVEDLKSDLLDFQASLIKRGRATQISPTAKNIRAFKYTLRVPTQETLQELTKGKRRAGRSRGLRLI